MASKMASKMVSKILSNFWKSKNQQNLFLIKAFFRGLNFYFWKSHMLLEKLFLTLSGNKKMHFKMPILLPTINFHLGLMHWLTNVRKVIYFLKLTSHKNKTNGLCLPIELKDICSVEKFPFFFLIQNTNNPWAVKTLTNY